MKIRTLVVAMAAFSFMLAACGNNQAKQEQQGQKEQNDDKNKQEVVEEQIQKEDLHSPALDEIRSVWKKKPLSGVAVDGKTDIVRFASVFCNAFPNFSANQAFLDYLKDPDAEYDKFRNVDIQKQNGYIFCNCRAVVGCDLMTCYWNCDNGHKLVAFDMVEEEDEPEIYDQLLLFYDYDPDTDQMNPAPALVETIEKAMAKYDFYEVGLPDEGKDIHITGEDRVNGEYHNYIYRWNGNGFDLEKTDK